MLTKIITKYWELCNSRKLTRYERQMERLMRSLMIRRDELEEKCYQLQKELDRQTDIAYRRYYGKD